ncbi:MAG: lipid II:glycine glycyltransferase FemX [Geminicoccaceae bacterium]
MGDVDATALNMQGDAWDRHLGANRPDVGFMQSSWWAHFLAERGWGHFGVFFRDGEEIVGGARVLTRTFASGLCYYYVPEGPVLPEDARDAEQVFGAMLAFIDKKRMQHPDLISHLRLEPRWQMRPAFAEGFREAGSWLEPRHTLQVDLAPGVPDILAQMKPKGRYNIKVATKHGVSVVEDMSESGAEDFLEIYDETMSRHGLGGKRQSYLLDLIDVLFEERCGRLFFAELDGERIAAALVVLHGDRATYFFGGSRPTRRRAMAPYLLHFEAMLKAKSLGYRWYDFYGIAPPDRTDHRWANISAFKRKFGGRELEFVPALDLIYDASAYEAYRRRKSPKSADATEQTPTLHLPQ